MKSELSHTEKNNLIIQNESMLTQHYTDSGRGVDDIYL